MKLAVAFVAAGVALLGYVGWLIHPTGGPAAVAGIMLVTVGWWIVPVGDRR